MKAKNVGPHPPFSLPPLNDESPMYNHSIYIFHDSSLCGRITHFIQPETFILLHSAAYVVKQKTNVKASPQTPVLTENQCCQ
jgi:hypothetical protein